jgi:hypothetical protein
MSAAASEGRKTLTISMAPDLYEDLESRARDGQVSVSEYVRGSVALRRYVEDRWVLLPWASRRWDLVLFVCAALASVLSVVGYLVSVTTVLTQLGIVASTATFFILVAKCIDPGRTPRTTRSGEDAALEAGCSTPTVDAIGAVDADAPVSES